MNLNVAITIMFMASVVLCIYGALSSDSRQLTCCNRQVNSVLELPAARIRPEMGQRAVGCLMTVWLSRPEAATGGGIAMISIDQDLYDVDELPILRRTKPEIVADWILKKIESGSFQEGSLLSESKLAEKLQVARSSVRTAL